MTRFNYTAEKNEGETYKGSIEAKDRFELYEIIRREGGHLLQLEESGGGAGFFSMEALNKRFGRISAQEKILMVRNMGAMLQAGLPLSRVLSVVERQTKNIRLRDIISQVSADVRHGLTFHDALQKHVDTFSGLMVAMVRAGEEGGDLASALITTSEQLERSNELKKKVRGAMIYPSIILIAIFIIAAVMMVTVIPTLSKTFEEMNATLPLSTRVVVGTSNFVTTHVFLSSAILAAIIGGLYTLLRLQSTKRARDYMFLKMPLIKESVREVNAAYTSRTLATLVSAGVDVLTALDICGEVVQNTYFRDVLKQARKEVTQGQPLSVTFIKNEDLYPAFVGEMMAVGEETGKTGEMLLRLAQYYEDEVDRKMKNMSTIIEPLLMLFIGAGVGFFAISMITPIYQISQHVQ